MKFPKKQILIGFIIGSIIAAILFFSTKTTVPITKIPLQQKQSSIVVEKRNPKQVIGFFPYWNLSKVNEVDLSNLSTIYYFAVDLNADGSWNTDDPGWSKMKSGNFALLKDITRKNGIRWGVTIVNLSADSIAKNINNQSRRQRIITNTIALMKEHDFQDLNIDLEYAGDSDPGLTQAHTAFVSEITSAIKHEIPNSQVSIDFFADVYKRPRIYDLQTISQIVDQIILMGYDFHRMSSIKAGPIAPLFGQENYQFDITTSVNGYLEMVPPEKLILGVPFYGYEWPTESNEKGAFVIHSSRGPEISSYKRTMETSAENKVPINFDNESKSAWFAYFDKSSKSWRQVWFENERSLGLKFDLVNDLNLAGIAIFALGYDGADAEPLWNEVKLKLK